MRSPPRTALALPAALALSVLTLSVPSAGRLHAQPATEPPPQVVVVLIAEAGASPELQDVIAELLSHQDVAPRFEPSARFDPDAWLDQSTDDASIWAFVRLRSEHRTQLYFRGPYGERFLLRELTLRAGLDELGRELIARVVETSVVALLHSSEGMSREEARAGLAQEAAEEPAPPPTAAAPPQAAEPRAAPKHPLAQRVTALLGLRVLGAWTGSALGARAALGLEAGATLRRPSWPTLRLRLAAELALPQSIERDAVEARVITLPLRLGLDLGTSFGLYLGLSTGADISHLDPKRTDDGGLMLSHASTEVVPCSRAELRYELSLGAPYWLAFAASVDVPWQVTRFEVVEAGMRRVVARPWAVQPGLALSFGVAP